MRQYTKDEAIEIIAADPELDVDYRELKKDTKKVIYNK